MSAVRFEVRARGQSDFYFEGINPTVMPRIGEHVELPDALGIVENVTWKPDREGGQGADTIIVIECRLASSAPQHASGDNRKWSAS